MAELTESTDDAATSTCCAPEQQADCCGPSDKAECCESESSSCGCSAGEGEGEKIREAVRVHDCAGSVIVRARKPI
jgi:arsenite methyltransferase